MLLNIKTNLAYNFVENINFRNQLKKHADCLEIDS
jgi:hypothetical protein